MQSEQNFYFLHILKEKEHTRRKILVKKMFIGETTITIIFIC